MSEKGGADTFEGVRDWPLLREPEACAARREGERSVLYSRPMSWHIKRTTGEEEGPLDAEEIARRARAGELEGVLLREDGATDWRPLAEHPALQSGSAAPAANAPAPANPPAPPPVQAAEPAAPAPPSEKAPFSVEAPSAQAASRRVVLVAAGLAVLLAVLALMMLFSRSRGAALASLFPAGVDVYLEVPSTKAALAELRKVAVFEANRIDEKAIVDDGARAIAATFEGDLKDARALVRALDGAAVAARSVTRKPDYAMLLRFSSTRPVEKLLASKRFEAQGAAGKAGKAYAVHAADPRPAQPSWADQAVIFLSMTGARVAWFEKPRVLALGSPALIDDIAGVVDGAAPLDKSAPYQEAKATLGEGVVVAFVDTSALRPLAESGRRTSSLRDS